jgi:hypothetical protein
MTIPAMRDELLNRPSTCQKVEDIDFGNGLCRDCNKKQSTIIRIMREFDSSSPELHWKQFKKFSYGLDATYSLCTACQQHVNNVLARKSTEYPPLVMKSQASSTNLQSTTNHHFSILEWIAFLSLLFSVSCITAIDWQRVESRAPLPVIGIPSEVTKMLQNLCRFRSHLCLLTVAALIILHGVCLKSLTSSVLTSLPWLLLIIVDHTIQHIPTTYFLALPIFSSMTSIFSIASCFSQHEKSESLDKTNRRKDNRSSSKEDTRKIQAQNLSHDSWREVQTGIDTLSLNGSFDETLDSNSTRSSSPTFSEASSATFSPNSSIIKPAKLKINGDNNPFMSTTRPKIAQMNHQLFLSDGIKVRQVSVQGTVRGSPWMYLHSEQVVDHSWGNTLTKRANSKMIPSASSNTITDGEQEGKSSNRTLSFVYTLVTLFLLILFIFACHRTSLVTSPSLSKITVVWEDTVSPSDIPSSSLAAPSLPSSSSGVDDRIPSRYLFSSTSNVTARTMYYLQLMTFK